MNKSGLLLLILIFVITGIFSGCAKMNIGPASSTEMSSESIQTAAAETMAAMPADQQVSPEPKFRLFLPMASGDDNTSSEGENTNPQAQEAIATPIPTNTPTATPVPDTPTPTTAPCLQAHFVEDINVPPGTKFTGGSKFTKIWRVKNTGSCPWYSTYTLVLVSGDGMGGGSDTTINAAVAPGQTVDLMIDLTAPKNDGRYKSAWMLYNLAGQVFGVGNDATGYLWADIKVVNAATATSKSSTKATATTKPNPTTAPSATTAPPTATTAPTSTSTPTPTPTPTYTETPTPTITNTP